jgi:hypothetical protein
MASSFPKDRFDEIPDDLQRVGAHRAPRDSGRAWVWIAWSALAAAVLVAVGIFGLNALNGNSSFKDTFTGGTPTPTATATPTPTPTIVPTVNPNLAVTVLNGTNEDGLATDFTKTLQGAGWTKIVTANATKTDYTQTTVYYSVAANEGAAQAIAKLIPGATTAMTQDYVETGADLTVVLGTDYKP